LESDVALPGGHLTRYVVGPHAPFWTLARRHPGDYAGQLVGEVSGTFNPYVESDYAVQVVAAHRLCQADLAGESASVRHLGAVDGDEPALLRPGAVGRVVDADNAHLIVGEQFAHDGFGEPKSVKHPTERSFVVHRGDLEVFVPGFAYFPTREVARRRSPARREHLH
jgi:hypothetical protein